MSASNWVICPRCELYRQAALTEREREVEDAYGRVSVEEFDRVRAALEADKAARLDESFREDYEIWGAEDGEVKVRYRGACAACNLRLSFEHAHPLNVDGAS